MYTCRSDPPSDVINVAPGLNIITLYFNILVIKVTFFDIILTSRLENFMYRTSRAAVSTSLKSLQGTCPTVMLMLGQCCHDVRTMCITKLICVLGNVVYVTWRIIFVNTGGPIIFFKFTVVTDFRSNVQQIHYDLVTLCTFQICGTI